MVKKNQQTKTAPESSKNVRLWVLVGKSLENEVKELEITFTIRLYIIKLRIAMKIYKMFTK